MDTILFSGHECYVLLNSISLISRQLESDNKELCAVKQFTIEKISPLVGFQPGTASLA